MKKKVSAAGGYFFKLHPHVAGTPDRLVLLPGKRAYLVELKSPKGSLSAIQTEMINRLQEAGHWVYILDSRKEIDAFILAKTGEGSEK